MPKRDYQSIPSNFIVDNAFTLEVFKMHVEPRGAIDIETTIVEDPFVELPQLVSAAITFDGRRSFVFKDDKYLKSAKFILEDTEWIMHNGLFDRLMMRRFGYDIPLKHDTMAMQYLLNPDEKKGLEELSERYLGLEPYKDVEYKTILDEPWDKVAAMNGEDAVRTYNLFRPLADQINADKQLSKIYQWLLMPTVNALIKVTEQGMPINKEKLDAITKLYEREVQEANSKLVGSAPQHPDGWPKPSWWRVRKDGTYEGDIFNPNSPQQVGYVLFEHFNLPVLTRTETGQPGTDADVLLQLEVRDENPTEATAFLTALRQYRKDNKILTSYLRSWPSFITTEDQMHPRFKPLHVVTGRLSSEKPNIQQVPRGTKFRSLFSAPDGHTWVKADYSQIELRVAAWLAQEPTMLEAFNEGNDIHGITAGYVLGDSGFRQGGKTLNFGLLYGAGPKTLQRVARNEYDVWFDFEEAKFHRENFFDLYPKLETWQRVTEREIIQSGTSRSPLGRIRYLPKARIPWEVEDMRTKKLAQIREGINHQVQSFAGDLTNMATARLVEAGLPVACTVHDEVNLIVRNKEVESAVDLVREVMEDVTWLERFGVNLTVPVEVDIETGKDWGNVS